MCSQRRWIRRWIWSWEDKDLLMQNNVDRPISQELMDLDLYNDQPLTCFWSVSSKTLVWSSSSSVAGWQEKETSRQCKMPWLFTDLLWPYSCLHSNFGATGYFLFLFLDIHVCAGWILCFGVLDCYFDVERPPAIAQSTDGECSRLLLLRLFCWGHSWWVIICIL